MKMVRPFFPNLARTLLWDTESMSHEEPSGSMLSPQRLFWGPRTETALFDEGFNRIRDTGAPRHLNLSYLELLEQG